MSIKNNFLDKNQNLNDNIKYPKYPKNKFVGGDKPSYVVNLEILSTGKKSDLEMKKVGTDIRPYVQYCDDSDDISKSLKIK